MDRRAHPHRHVSNFAPRRAARPLTWVAAVWLLAAHASAQSGGSTAPAVAGETRVDASLPATSVRVAGVALDVGCVVSGAVRAGDHVFVSCTGGRVRAYVVGASGTFTLIEERRAPGEISALFVADGAAWALSDGQAMPVAAFPTVEVAGAVAETAPSATPVAPAAPAGPAASSETGTSSAATRRTSAPTRAPAAAPPADPETDAASRFPSRDRLGRTLTGSRREHQSDRPLWAAGLGLFIAGWALDIIGTAIFNAVSHDRTDAAEQDAMAWSLLPFAGPLIQLGVEAPHPALPVTAGLLQISGCVLFIVGMTTTHEREIPIYGFGDSGRATASIGFDVAPTDGGAFATVTLHTM